MPNHPVYAAFTRRTSFSSLCLAVCSLCFLAACDATTATGTTALNATAGPVVTREPTPTRIAGTFGLEPQTTPSVSTQPLLALPFYMNAQERDFGATFAQNVKQLISPVLGKDSAGKVAIQLSVTTDSATRIVGFYEQTLAQRGLAKVGWLDTPFLAQEQNIPVVTALFTPTPNTSSSVLLAVIGPLTQAHIAALLQKGAKPDVPLNAGESLIETFSGFSSSVVSPAMIIPDANPVSQLPNLPAYPNAVPLGIDVHLIQTIKNGLSTLLGTQASNAARVDIYTLRDSPNTLVSFYKTALSPLGYTSLGKLKPASLAWFGTTPATTHVFGKGKQDKATGAFVLVVGPYDPARDTTTLATRPLLATLPAGSSLLITVSNLNLATLPPNALQPES